MAVGFHINDKIDQFLIKAGTSVLELVNYYNDDSDEEIPIVLHLFSNGAGFCRHRL